MTSEESFILHSTVGKRAKRIPDTTVETTLIKNYSLSTYFLTILVKIHFQEVSAKNVKFRHACLVWYSSVKEQTVNLNLILIFSIEQPMRGNI